MVQVFKYIIDINFLVIDGIFSANFNFNNQMINVGNLFCDSIMIFYAIKCLLNVLGISKELTSEE